MTKSKRRPQKSKKSDKNFGYPYGGIGWGGWGAELGWTSQNDGCLSGAQFSDGDTAGSLTSGDSGTTASV